MFPYRIKPVTLAAALLFSPSLYAVAGPAEDQFAVAASHYKQLRWHLAGDEFQAFLDKHGDHELAGQAIFFRSESLVQLGNLEKAADGFRRYLDSRSAPPMAHVARFRLGETAYLRQSGDVAQQALEGFHRHHPNDSRNEFALVYLGELALEKGDALAAGQWFSQALSKYPKSELVGDCHFGVARAALEMHDFGKADSHFRILSEQPDHPMADDAQLQRGLLEFKRKRYQRAADHLRAFETKWKQSDLRTTALHWLGLSYRAQHKWSQAAEALSAAVSNDPVNTAAAEIHFFAAQAYQQNSDSTAALAHYDAILRNWAHDSLADDSLLAKLEIAFAAGQYSESETSAERLARDFPHSDLLDRARQVHVRALLKQKKYLASQQLFERQLQTKGSLPDGDSWYLYALAQLGLHQYEEAVGSLHEVEIHKQEPVLQGGVHVALATAQMGLEQFKEAIGPLLAYLDLFPEGQDVAKCRCDLAICYSQTGQLKEAAATYEKYLQQHSDHPLLMPLTHFLAETAYAQGDLVLANTLFAQLAKDGNPSEYVEKGLSGLAWGQLHNGQAGDAAKKFEQIFESNPGSPLAAGSVLTRAKVLERESDFDGALAAYQLVIDRYDGTEQFPQALFGAARLLDRIGHDQKAHELLLTLDKRVPDYNRLDLALYTHAWVLSDLQREEESIALFERLHQSYPESECWPDTTFRLAEQASEAKQYDRAYELCTQMIDHGCDSTLLGHALYLQGRVRALSHRWTEVEAPLGRMVRELPDHVLAVHARYWIAEAFYRQGRYSQAADHFSPLESWTESQREPWMGIIPLRQAQMLAHQKQWDQVYEIASAIGTRFPEFRQQYEVDYLLGRCLASRGKFSEARRSYQLVVDSTAGIQTETAAMAQWMIGESFFHQKQYQEAIRSFLRVDILYPYPQWKAYALLQAGKCYEKLGNWREAIELYARILKEHPQATVTEEASQRLRMTSLGGKQNNPGRRSSTR